MIIEIKKGSNLQLSDNFNSDEFDCRCDECTITLIDLCHVDTLQMVRNEAGPVWITSGYRCKKHNKNVGGAEDSQHPKGTAADLVPKLISIKKLAKIAQKHGVKGLGIYKTFVHVDNRIGKKARWSVR